MRTTNRLRALLVLLVVALVAVTAVSVASAATPTNASQWCKAWAKGELVSERDKLFPAAVGKSYVDFFATKTKNSAKTKKNLHGACVSQTAKKLAAAKGEKDDDDGTKSAARLACEADQKANATKFAQDYKNMGQCVAAKNKAKEKPKDDD